MSLDADVIIPVTTATEETYHMAVMALRTCQASTTARVWAYINNSPPSVRLDRLRNQCEMLGIGVRMWDGPFSISKIFNDGTRTTTGEFIAHGTSDVIYFPNWLENIVDLWRENPDYFTLCNWIFDALNMPCVQHRIVNERRIIHTGNPSAGVNVFRRRDGWMWDEAFDLWEIDADLFYFLERNHLKAGICLNARCDHLIEAVRKHAPQGPATDFNPTAYLRKKWGLAADG